MTLGSGPLSHPPVWCLRGGGAGRAAAAMSLSKRKALKRLSTAMSSDLKSSSGAGDIIRELRPSSTPSPLPEPKSPAAKIDNPPHPKMPPASSLSSLFQSAAPAATKKTAEASDLGGEGVGKLRGRFSEVLMLKEICKSVGGACSRCSCSSIKMLAFAPLRCGNVQFCV